MYDQGNESVSSPASHIFIEVSVPFSNANQMELILTRCCQKSGDTLLAKDLTYDERSVRYLVQLATEEEQRMLNHVNILIPALKHGLLAFTFLSVPLLIEVTWPDLYRENEVQSLMRTFPFKEQGSKAYTAAHRLRTMYITRPHDYILDGDQVQWLANHCTSCRTL